MAKIRTYARPTWLYRYRSLGLASGDVDRATNAQLKQEMDAVFGNYVFCPTYKEMNDPMEGFYRASQKASAHGQYDAFVDQLRSEKLGVGIASFSETWDNGLMWAHYADGFQGMCVCYSMTKLLEGTTAEHSFARVAYGSKPHYLNLPGLSDDRERARAVLSTKHLSWAYEREWRIFSPQPGPAAHGAAAVRSIYLGARIPAPKRRQIREMLQELDVPVHTTSVDGYTVVKRNSKSGAE